MQVPFNRVEVSSSERQKINQVLDGKARGVIEDFEEAIEKYTGAQFALATSHGTSALHLAMLAINLKRGDKVLCSVDAFPSVPEVVRHFDAEPIFIDIDPQTYNVDLDKLETYLADNKSKKLKAVIVSHIAGQCTNLERLYNIAHIYDVKIIEDAAEALGATFKGAKIGSTGADITCFGFSPHLKNAYSNGGVMVSDDEDIIERAILLRNHAMVVDEDSLEYIYDIVDIGSKYTISPLDAAYNLEKLKTQDKNITRQREIAAIYNEQLSGVAHISLPTINDDHACSLYIIKIDKNRDSFARELDAKGIQTGLHYIPLHLMSYYKSKYSLRVNDFPVALQTFQQVLSIPNFASMTDKEIKYVCESIKEISKTRV
ncbi:MAG: DegT/DnrJ/EryC1/StrS aminotransferase family protein [Campylobacterota bacterium]|nr:DegT/DnrJ/EryC1/StrS aminotransferase family protein [Campylobacterota bacterium]